jgi:hypothetical protein
VESLFERVLGNLPELTVFESGSRRCLVRVGSVPLFTVGCKDNEDILDDWGRPGDWCPLQALAYYFHGPELIGQQSPGIV